MRKLVFFIILLAVFAARSSWATISVNWASDQNNNQFIVQLDGTTPLPVNSIIQFLYSASGAIGALNPSDPLIPQGDNVLLTTYYNTSAGYWVGVTKDYGSSTGEYVGGYLFVRIFDVQQGDTPTVGDYYVDGMLSGTTVESPTLNYVYAFSSDGSPLLVDTIIAVPEPATIGLAFTAIGLFVIRRFRNKKKDA